MTLPNERTRAVRYTREFLRRLLNPKETPRIPKAIRREAYYLLKHYPANYELDSVLDGKVFGKDGYEKN